MCPSGQTRARRNKDSRWSQQQKMSLSHSNQQVLSLTNKTDQKVRRLREVLNNLTQVSNCNCNLRKKANVVNR